MAAVESALAILLGDEPVDPREALLAWAADLPCDAELLARFEHAVTRVKPGAAMRPGAAANLGLRAERGRLARVDLVGDA